MKMFPSFWITEFVKELLNIVSNESTLINTSFHYGTIWKEALVPQGAQFWKSNKPSDHVT